MRRAATHVAGLAAATLSLAAGAARADEAPTASSIEPPSRARGATLARVVEPARARPRLASARGETRLDSRTAWSGQGQTLLVLDAAVHDQREWVRVVLPSRPNGGAGWIPRDKVQLSRTRYWVAVRTRSRTLSVYRDGERLRRFRAVVGAPATPTPHLLAALYERNRQPDPRAFLGPWSLPLTAFSEVLEDYGGGPGRVAIHGRAGASFADPLGSARSHGCVRITNRAIRYLARTLRNGTPVRLRS
jgi:lipoprotein-anchoring transpeptidase ErfK/SrfK